jgi:hypothetical protein
MQDAANVTPDRWLEDGDQVEVGELTLPPSAEVAVRAHVEPILLKGG